MGKGIPKTFFSFSESYKCDRNIIWFSIFNVLIFPFNGIFCDIKKFILNVCPSQFLWLSSKQLIQYLYFYTFYLILGWCFWTQSSQNTLYKSVIATWWTIKIPQWHTTLKSLSNFSIGRMETYNPLIEIRNDDGSMQW